MRLHREVAAPLSPRALSELETAGAILPLLTVSTKMPWRSYMIATDASPFGLGICGRSCDVGTIASYGRQSEKGRHRTADAIQARDDASHPEGGTGSPGQSLNDSLPFPERQARTVPEIDPAVLIPSLWHLLHTEPITTQTHITKTEARGVACRVSHLMRSAGNLGQRHLSLRDDIAYVLSFGKDRPDSPSLCGVLRESGAHALATCSSVVARWIPSELNVANGPSSGRLNDLKRASDYHPFGPAFGSQTALTPMKVSVDTAADAFDQLIDDDDIIGTCDDELLAKTLGPVDCAFRRPLLGLGDAHQIIDVPRAHLALKASKTADPPRELLPLPLLRLAASAGAT